MKVNFRNEREREIGELKKGQAVNKTVKKDKPTKKEIRH